MSDRTPLMAGNWKMHKTPSQAAKDAATLVQLCQGANGVEAMIAPTFPCLVPVAQAVSGSIVALGAQNMYWEEKGAFTGEVSAEMLLDAGCRYVIIGHSERRQYFGETDETVNKRTKAALAAGLCPVVCVGETKEEREQGKTLQVLDKQVGDGLNNLSFSADRQLVVAYEPVWAIGTGLTATIDQAQEAHAHIRGLLEKLFSKDLANQTRILYGGSVKPENAQDLMSMEDIDGGLVGGASLDPEVFVKIVRFSDG